MWYKIKLHFKYLTTKTNLILFVIMTILLGSILFFSSSISSSFEEKWMNMESLKESYTSFTKNIFKIIIPLISIFLFGHSFTDYQDNYLCLFHTNRHARIPFFLTKIMAISIVIVSIVFINFSLFIFFGIISLPNFSVFDFDLKFWTNLLFISLIYGFVAIIAINITNHDLSYISIFVVYIIINSINDMSDEGFHLLNLVLPSMSDNQVVISSISLIGILILYMVASFWIYYFKRR